MYEYPALVFGQFESAAVCNYAVPAAVIDRLADRQVVVVGETHLIREQRQFTAVLADWVLSEYAVDGDRKPDWWRPGDFFWWI